MYQKRKCDECGRDECGRMVRAWVLFVQPGEPRDLYVCLDCVTDETVRAAEEYPDEATD